VTHLLSLALRDDSAVEQLTPQDYVLAHMWFNLAAAKCCADPDGNLVKARAVSAASLRDEVAKLMTPSQIEKAQALAAAWKPTTGQ
jgi:uncharacterized protein